MNSRGGSFACRDISVPRTNRPFWIIQFLIGMRCVAREKGGSRTRTQATLPVLGAYSVSPLLFSC